MVSDLNLGLRFKGGSEWFENLTGKSSFAGTAVLACFVLIVQKFKRFYCNWEARHHG